jgi:polyphosphate kinase
VEALVPIDEPKWRAWLDQLLERLLAADTIAWELHMDGSWHRNAGTVDAQVWLQTATPGAERVDEPR